MPRRILFLICYVQYMMLCAVLFPFSMLTNGLPDQGWTIALLLFEAPMFLITGVELVRQRLKPDRYRLLTDFPEMSVKETLAAHPLWFALPAVAWAALIVWVARFFMQVQPGYMGPPAVYMAGFVICFIGVHALSSYRFLGRKYEDYDAAGSVAGPTDAPRAV